MCPLQLFCSDYSQKCEWKIMNIEETHGKTSNEKSFNLKTRYCFPEFSWKHNIQSSCDLPKFCHNYLANTQTVNDA